ncbi:MAG: sugar phosphate isomerase/epimerase [Bifidobacteriaceae bacterium]|jgi:myo-inositol catabolism protein IolH|nr:sugar phosphate isomerase/epimerase [Bifidobacteriaceae bacterium]
MSPRILLDPALLADRPLREAFEATAETGYDGVELGNRPDIIPAYGPISLGTGDFKALRADARRAGTEIRSVAVIQSWASPDEDQRAQAVQWFREGIEATVELGVGRVNSELTGDPARPEASRQAWLRSVAELLPVIERHGLELRVEPHPGDFIETTGAALDLFAEVGHPALGYLHCLPHSFYLGGTITEQFARAGARVDHLHIADSFRPERTILNPPNPDIRVHQHFDVGWGELDWREARTALSGFDGLASVQVYFWNERARASFAANRAAAAWLFAAPDVSSQPGPGA